MFLADRASGVSSHLFHGVLDRVGSFLDGLLGFPDCLVSLSFLAKLVITGQCAGSFLNPTFHYVCLATLDYDSFF